jgi:hypothetical protein
MKTFAVIGLCVLAAFPAWAGDQAPARMRLVTGSVAPMPSLLAAPGSEATLFAIGGFSVGAVTSNPANPDHSMAMGGFAAYSFDALRLSSAFRGDGIGAAADFTASYSGGMMGIDGVTALNLGYERFSPNPVQTNMAGGDVWRPMGDLSLSLSFTQGITSSMSWGGFAAATRSEDDETVHSGFRLGAGLGLKF